MKSGWGKALKDGYRNKVFLMTKIDGRTKEVAARQIDTCLERLQTDHIDLLQHHSKSSGSTIQTGYFQRAGRMRPYWKRRKRGRFGI